MYIILSLSVPLPLDQWWDVGRGEALQTFYPRGVNLKRLHVSPDFSTFVTVDNIGIHYVLQRVEGPLPEPHPHTAPYAQST